MSILINKKWELQIDGESILDEYYFTDLRIVQEINRPNELKFNLIKKTLAETEDDLRFSLSKQILGKTVEVSFKTMDGSIEIGKNENDGEMFNFKGIICNVSASRPSMQETLSYNVSAYSADYLLMDNPHCFSFEDKTLKDIVSETLKPFDSTIDIEIDPAFTDEIHYTVQYNETTYAFLNRLAMRYGEWFYYDGEKLVFGKVQKPNGNNPIELVPSTDILSYNYQMMVNHFNFSHHQHNYLTCENTNQTANSALNEEEPEHGMTKIALDASKDIYKKETFHFFNGGITEENNFDEIELSTKIHTLGKQAQLAICSGTSNSVELKLGSTFSLNEDYKDERNANTDDSANYEHDSLLVIKIVHNINSKGVYENQFTAIPAETTIPPYNYNAPFPKAEPQRAVVIDNKDPEKLGRIRVQFLWQTEQDSNMMTPWIRIAQPYGGDEKGFYFIPEIDEEVMVSFENGNAEKPYVTGTLWYGKQKPPEDWYNDENDAKVIRSRNGHSIAFIDEGDGGKILIWDRKNMNYVIEYNTDEKLIKMQSKGNIELYADKDIIMKAGGNVKIKADKEVDVKSGGDTKFKVEGDYGMDVDGKTSIVSQGRIYVDTGEHVRFNAATQFAVKADEDIIFEAGGEGIKYSTDGDLKLLATGSTEIKADTSIEINAGTDMKIKSGATMDVGGTSIKIDGGPQTELKGGMVKIN